MRMNFSSVGEYNNSIYMAKYVPLPVLSLAQEALEFNNGVAVHKLTTLMTASAISIFNNDQIGSIKNAAKPTVGVYSSIAQYNNGVDGSKKYLVLNYHESIRWFDNSIDILIGGYKPKIETGNTTSIASFNNSYAGKWAFDMGGWSLGVFDLNANISLLNYEEYGYNEVKADLVYPTLTYNWFDNSIPSIKVIGQFYNIPWGYAGDMLQFSVRFPEEAMEVSTEIVGLNKREEVEVQWFATPPRQADESLEIQAQSELDKWHMEIQYTKGFALDRVLEIQAETLRKRTERLDTQSKVEATVKEQLELQGSVVRHEEELLEIAMGSIISKKEPLGLQLKTGWNELYELELQGEVLSDRAERLQIQVTTAIPTNESLEISSRVEWPTDETLELQYKWNTAMESGLDYQVDIPHFTQDGELELQWFATPPIALDSSLELQLKTGFDGEDVLEIEYHVDRFNQGSNMEVMWLQSAKVDDTLELQYQTVVETTISVQQYVVPWGYAVVPSQMKLLSTSKGGLELQFSNVITKEYQLELQNNTVIEMDAPLELGWFTSINRDYSLELGYNVSEITKEYVQEIQYLLNERVDYPLEISNMTVIEMDIALEVMFDTILTKNYPLDIQSFVEITKEFNLELSYVVSQITTEMELELQFDILDLVYYMVYEGYNIVPWWSDGLGKWDTGSEKNWDKEDLGNTMADNLVLQLNEIGLDAEVGEMMNVADRNFMYYRELLNTDLNNKVLKLVNKDSVKKFLTLGKSKKDKTATIRLLTGDNVFYYDGAEETFDAAVRTQIDDKIQHTLVWKPQDGEWERFTADRAVYFYEDINGKDMPMPYVFVINVTEDCEITINR